MRFWTDLSRSAIYKLLRKLEKDGLVTSKKQVSSENRLQRLYSLNKKGKSALQEKLGGILRSPEHLRWQIDIGVYNSDLLTKEEVKAALNEYRNELQKEIIGYRNLLKFLVESKCPKHRFELAKRPVFLLEAEIKWVDAYLSELESE